MANPAFRLQDAGFSREQVDALSDWIDGAAATKADLLRTEATLKEDIAEVRGEIAEVRGEIAGVRTEIAAVRGEVSAVESNLNGRISAVESRLNGRIDTLAAKLDTHTRYTLLIGGLILATIIGQWVFGPLGG